MAQIRGIDVSQDQGNIDWKAVREDGIRFAMIRAGNCGYDGKIKVDTRFHSNIAAAISAGINVGVYLYSYARTEQAAKQAAEELIPLLKGYTVTYPVAFDMEDETYNAFSKDANTAIANAFLNEIKEQRYYPVLYSYTYFLTENLDMSKLSDYDVWVADYRGYVGYQGSYGMWQYSSKGRVDGISTRVDMDVSYRDYPTLIRKEGLNDLEPKELKWMIDIFSFREQARAEEVAEGFRNLGYYSVVKPLGNQWQVQMFTFRERSRAEAVSGAITTLGFYNVVREYPN